MQQCDSPFIVKYYGSYFKNTALWVGKVNEQGHEILLLNSSLRVAG